MGYEQQYLDLTLVPTGLLLLSAYHAWLLYRIIKHPTTTVIGINALNREIWVDIMMADGIKNGVLAVQTLRNNIMASTLLGSTAITLSSLIGAKSKLDFPSQTEANSQFEPFSAMDSRDRFNGDDGIGAKTYSISGKIMLVAMVILFTVVLFILGLHIYARCVWQRSLGLNRRRGGSSRRRRLAFAGDQDPARLHRIGLEKSVIEALPVFVYRAENHKEEGLECAVCLCEFEENEKARLLPKCNHSFHIDCIDMWFDSHSTCPLCRTSAQPDQVLSEVDGRSVAVGETSGTAGEEQVPSVSITVDGQAELCESCRHRDDGGLLSPTYPTNVLFWGTQNRANLRLSSNLVEGTSSRKSMERIVVDIPPRRPDSFSSPRDNQQLFSPGGPSSLKSPGTRLRSLKRILTRGVPQSPDGSVYSELGGSAQV